MRLLDPNTSEWLNLFARWFHVFAGILWVGTTYYFTWLDARLSEAEVHARGTGDKPQVWMVHSGGFYVVEKQKQPGTQELHWFRWEAGLTWLSGMVLLVVVYYLGGALVDPDVRDISIAAAVAFSIGLLVVGWVVYDLLMLSPLGKNELAFAGVGYALLVGVAYLLTHILSGRAVYIHMGALMGTLMVANVWMRILPAQRKMIAATSRGETPDARLGAQAKLRSKQNTFMAVPVVLTMISNHFPTATYGSRYNWIILSVLILVGWVAAKIIRRA
ncbi:MAG TPA: urate hydroxylase PuuD [Pyrinomonadaceae bacterium]|nr:urate hydroxylase PuuD [Pyrinomonadaceae bacterium]